ncbi:MAG: 50S ribosomal protein L21 [Candidatus Methanoperedens nitroreducens]|uniref:Large ribosomal subunit protein eL21 n=1 Tax=Candidatus Methanoperedens nitratireducens TaxID=1392998 RepID=A0A0P8A1P7_9EURY|nr:50S ribosomal protein L21e [Candidatus Methanoperedens sp. BLZ2]KAB2944941.1 MAG: 50S ribosomal protein L21e [Candidatus Methanoperedens sp.]KPQ41934.1 MAG: 50S ribosomal protein L21 [Candidatus Methanoperedens sp. BLZ1]MBZ0177535.1 50S ribosomal protein L21e [Candidatus Methanoperedens nitroreducens]VVB51842.1 50S ribosomal protein L21e [uncultured archaeon]MCX9076577.1 50S ribosomal protein L21e [Candidatus Methanoperedens sp.]
MAKTHGTRRKSRYKLKKTVREKGLSPISRAIQEFHEGDIVNIDLDPSIQNGMPHPKFQGRTGKVMTQRGRAYIVEVRDGGLMKEVIILPEHLTPQN